MPHISVLIPVYNGADAIARALRSVQNQSYRDFEVLVLDDGSRDETAEIVRGFPEVQLITRENRGIGATRQELIERATGEWIAFIDHDDEWRPDKLAMQIEVAKDTVLVHSRFKTRQLGKATKTTLWSPPPNACVLDHLLPDNQVGTSSALIRRDAMLKVGFAQDLSKAEDWLAWFGLAALGDFAFVPRRLAIKYEREGSASAPTPEWFQAERLVLEKHVLPNFDQWYDRLSDQDKERHRRMIRRKLGVIASLEAAALDAKGNRSLARSRHLEALRTAPSKGSMMRFIKHVAHL